MKKSISETTFNLSIYWRWILFPAFIIFVYAVWGWREYLFSYMPFNKIFTYPLAEISNYAVLALVGVIFLLAVI